ncbi:hypothetical protein CVU76_02040 [Candidatus Dojkabacteria bacterium HGW-Dojkabacteria-1]|uniref:CopC domain-containing protein n=1 Tax=Candidatus Dojkabacteria bacterium HGW-Dojkabacteria-1 TaxID=2013761 RepID=A0A2N2F3N2_9BACT|nr:MAG: hypothetical protein CVU76_02040 [Candidatus Dojkabacteria bacterium HGW-Dojkabacteria-1]
MKIISFLLLPIILLTSTLYSFAQEVVVDEDVAESESKPVVVENTEKKTVTSTNKYFELELIRGTQSPLNKSIPFTLYITPKIDSERTQILWELPSTLEARTSHREFVNLQKDQTYKFNVSIKPQREGSYDVTANVIAWEYNTNYTNSVSSTITLSNNLVVQPVDSEYSVSIMLMFVIGLIILAVGGFLVYKSSDKVVKRLKIWLTPPY